jgi:uncharacterized protein DUF5615
LRILLDENVPFGLARHLIGHDVRSVQRRRWSGLKDGMLLRRAATEFEAIITTDRSIEYQQRFLLPSQ